MLLRTPGQPPALALGTMNFGKRTPAEESARIVRRALERGIRTFDTANAYGDGEAERILGQALGRDREGVAVSSKVGFARVAGKPEGLSPAVIESAIAASLQRLGTSYVDVYYLHVPDPATPIERTLDAIRLLLDSSRVRAWAVSNYASWQILEMNQLVDARDMARPVASQVIYNAIHRQLDIEYFAFARRYPIHTTVFNPLAGGLLSGTHRFEEVPSKGSRFDDNALYKRRYWTRAMFDRVDQLRGVAEREGMSLVELSYAWVASREGVDSILVGPASIEQLDAAIDAVGRTLSKDSLSFIDQLWREWNGTDTNYTR